MSEDEEPKKPDKTTSPPIRPENKLEKADLRFKESQEFKKDDSKGDSEEED